MVYSMEVVDTIENKVKITFLLLVSLNVSNYTADIYSINVL